MSRDTSNSDLPKQRIFWAAVGSFAACAIALVSYRRHRYAAYRLEVLEKRQARKDAKKAKKAALLKGFPHPRVLGKPVRYVMRGT